MAHQSELRELSRPHLTKPIVNLPLAMLAPTTSVRGGTRTLSVPSSAPFVVVILGLGDAPTYPGYRLEVREPGSTEVIWSSSKLIRTDVTELSVALPRPLIVGERRLSVFGIEDNEDNEDNNTGDELLATYDLKVKELT